MSTNCPEDNGDNSCVRTVTVTHEAHHKSFPMGSPWGKRGQSVSVSFPITEKKAEL